MNFVVGCMYVDNDMTVDVGVFGSLTGQQKLVVSPLWLLVNCRRMIST